MKEKALEILINATRVNKTNSADLYEFVLNDLLYVTECVHVQSLIDSIIHPVDNYLSTLNNVLFELNHVRVNPALDNTQIINALTEQLEAIGVKVHNPPSEDTMAICYRPLGEITENVRFYFSESGSCVFLCPNAKLKALPTSTSDKIHQFNKKPDWPLR